MYSSSSNRGRLFFAAIPDAAAVAQIHRLAGLLKNAHKFNGKLIEPERLHISLFFLGELPGPIVSAACEAADEVRAQPFEVRFDRTASFRGKPGSRPFVLVGEAGLRQLETFRQNLGVAMARKGLKRLGELLRILPRTLRSYMTSATSKNIRSTRSHGR